MNYYFLAPSLPPLELGKKPELSSEELRSRLELNLSKEDFKKVVILRRFTDLNNIRSLLMEEPIDPRGNLGEKELDEALLIRNILPQYVFDFLDRYDTVSARLSHFSGLLVQYFREEIEAASGFLKKYLIFERQWRLVLTALRAKALGRDIAKELQFEDPADTLVMQILAQKDAADYEPPEEYAEVKALWLACQRDPWQLHKAFVAWRFKKVEELVDHPLFSIDWILAYLVQLMLVEMGNELDEEKGLMILDTFKEA
jgi:hypothetical protein